jgi:hypothetical protein
MTKMKRLLAICGLALVAGTATCLLVSALYPLLRETYHDYFEGPHRPAYLNRNMSEWLQILALTNATKEPLRIMQISCDRTSHIASVEVPLSYDLLCRYGFLDKDHSTFDIANKDHSKFGIAINGYNVSSGRWPGPDGGCRLAFDLRHLNLGTNQIRVEFMIFNRTNVEYIEATGPATELVWTNEEKWPPKF